MSVRSVDVLMVKILPDEARGTTYPDMPWEPKQSFRAVANVYGAT